MITTPGAPPQPAPATITTITITPTITAHLRCQIPMLLWPLRWPRSWQSASTRSYICAPSIPSQPSSPSATSTTPSDSQGTPKSALG
ncbi:hypothetical protein EMPG_16544 [Blastomyces silverae]|uniref:Uncharacterized protein n=1 Tax=Blastomyces silverae TaxID=2060906 RepID=A0A0H1BAF8_9EURO|nr:hypothetical protein EMPG_16544 [Blastomyces silverae]